MHVCLYVWLYTQADLDEVSLLDESYNRVASILSVQCNIACSSSCCEVNVLFELFKGFFSNHFDDQQVTKVVYSYRCIKSKANTAFVFSGGTANF